MSINKTNGITDNQKREMIYTTTGLGAGAIAGGLYGHAQKPWFNNDNLTDTFIKQVEDTELKLTQKDFEDEIAELKKMTQTGSLDNVSELTLQNLGIEDRKIAPDKIKNIAKDKLDLMQDLYEAKDHDDIITQYRTFLDEANGATVENRLKKIAELKKVGGKDDEIKLLEDLNLKYKKRITDNFDMGKKSFKALKEDADRGDRILYNAIKENIDRISFKNAGKWAGICAAALGSIAFLTAMFTGKKPDVK